MQVDSQQKVTAEHLKRSAYLYIRQSTLRQVLENTESTKRQYALRERAVALGWTSESIVVIDSDLGQSGAQAADREGFQRLAADVSLGRAGVVIGLEVSRLARNSADWHRLLEICALAGTLILDEDGIYDPAHFNDRLLLGLKGTMSEAELHVIRARLTGGIISKARRGELRKDLPVGFVYNDDGNVELDPDQQVQKTIRLFFDTFHQTGSAYAAGRHFYKEKILFPVKVRKGPSRGEIAWEQLTHSRALQILHNPRYAGAYFFGRHKSRKRPGGGRAYTKVPPADWLSFIPNAHEGYITLEQYDANQKRLKESAQTYRDRIKTPPREGPALLQGLAICGMCGDRMSIRYHSRNGKLVPDYVCSRRSVQRCQSKLCQKAAGSVIDAYISQLLIETVSPMALKVALSVQSELESRLKEADHIRKQHVERHRYEAELARRRFLRVDPDNRLVAASLEADWNEKLRNLTSSEQEYEKLSAADHKLLSQEQRQQILALSSDFPKLWRRTDISDRERKRIVRLILEDVTIKREPTEIKLFIRFKGGATKLVSLAPPPTTAELHRTKKDIIDEIDRMLDDHSYVEIAEALNKKGLRTGYGRNFTEDNVMRLRMTYHLKPRYDRLRAKGFLTSGEIAKMLGTYVAKVHELRMAGILKCVPAGHGRDVLFLPPDRKTMRFISNVQKKNFACLPKECLLNYK